MKWLMALLGLFRNPRNIVKERSDQIKFDHLAAWLEKQSKELLEKEKLSDYLTSYFNFLKDKRWLLQKHVEEGHNVPEDLRSECEEFLQFLNIEDNFSLNGASLKETSLKETSLKDIIALNSKLEEKLRKILPNKEVELVNPLLKLFSEIDNARKMFTDKMNLSGYPRIANLNKRLNMLQTYKYRVDKCEEELRSKRRRLYLTEEKKKEKEEQLGSLRKDKEGLLIIETRKKNESLNKEIEDTEEQVLNFFSEIKSLLQKYSSLIDTNRLLSSYIDDPLNAFLNDEGLSIKHSLQHLRAVLNSGKLSWSVEENISFLKKLDLMEEDEMEKTQIKLLDLKRRRLELTSEPSVDEGKLLEIDDAEYRLQHFTEQINKLEDDISSLEEKIDNLKDEWSKELQLFQNLVSIGFGIELDVTVDFSKRS